MIGISLSLKAHAATLARAGFSRLYRDLFTDVDSAPLASGPCFPGPGTRTVTGGDRFYTNGVALNMTTGGPDDARVQYGEVDYAAGLGFLFAMGSGGINTNCYWGETGADNFVFGWTKNGCVNNGRTVIGTPGFSAYDRYAVVRLADGLCAWLHRSMEEDGLSWRLWYTSANSSTIPLAGTIGSGNWSGASTAIDCANVVQFTSETLASKAGMSIFNSAAPASEAEVQFEHGDDFFLELLVEDSTALTEILLRTIDAQNTLEIIIEDGSLELSDISLGVPSVLGTKTVPNNSRVLFIADGNSVLVAVDDGVNNPSFSSYTSYKDGTAGSIYHESAVSNIFVYPRFPVDSTALDTVFRGATDPFADYVPGGYGQWATGGEGGVTIYVNNEEELYNALSGIGDGLTPATPRIVKFGGSSGDFIDLTQRLEIVGASNVTFDGSGSCTVVRRHDKKFFGCANIVFRDLTLAGGEAEYHDGTCHAAQFVDCHSINIQNCTFVFASDETLSFTECDDIYIGMCLIGDAIPPQRYGLFFAGGNCNRVHVVDTAIINCEVRTPYTQGGAGHHYRNIYVHGTYVGTYAHADYGNIQLNIIGNVFGTDLTDSGGADWIHIWSHPIVPYEAIVHWDEDSPIRLDPAQYLGNIIQDPAPIQDVANVPVAYGDPSTLVADLIALAGRRIYTDPLEFDNTTLVFKQRMEEPPDLLDAPYWEECSQGGPE